MIGAVIGFFCRGRLLLEGILATGTSIAYYAFLIWRFPDPDVWSWRYPITSLIYQWPWYAVLYFAPTFVLSALVGKLRAGGNKDRGPGSGP